MSVKVRREVEFFRPAIQANEHYTEIEVTEMTKIRKRQLKVRHIYWVPAGLALENRAAYVLPLDQSTINTQTDWVQYRATFNILSAAAIENIRTSYNLSGREFAEVLGISHSTLSQLENNLVLQSDEQDSLLRLASCPAAFLALFKQRQPILVAAFGDARYQTILGQLTHQIIND